MLTYNKKLKQPSRRLRKAVTDAERRLWARIGRDRIASCRFYRQKPIGDYIVDFYCPRAKLVIEVDGGQHLTRNGVGYDLVRSEYLATLGLKVLRFTNTEVLRDTDAVVESILEILGEISLNPSFSKRDKPSSTMGRLPLKKGD